MTKAMKQTVWRDGAGAVIHIGEWDYQMGPSLIIAEGGEPILTHEHDEFGGIKLDKQGLPLTRPAEPGELLGYDEANPVAYNPIPGGASHSKEQIVRRADGGLAVASDYASLRRAAYPSIADQLDALWKGGDEAEAMRKRMADVKKKHPKPRGAS